MWLLLAVWSGLTAPADAEETTHALSEIVPPALGYDLSTQPWFASADLPPESSPARIRELATATSPTVILRSGTATKSGILFCILSLRETADQQLGGRITIGDIDGEDEAYFNGVKIGESHGWGVTDLGIPRQYDIPPAALRAGENVLALRIFAWRNKPTFGIKRLPLTFAFTAPQEPRPNTMEAAARHDAIDADRARRAIFAADPELSSTERLHRKRPGFGRFGEFLFDGLPAMAEVSPTRISSRKGPVIEIALDDVSSASVVNDTALPGVDPWHKLTRVVGTSSQQVIQYTVHSNVLYPGAILKLEKGAVLPLRVRLAGRAGVILQASPEELNHAGVRVSKKSTVDVYVLGDAATATPPAVLVLSGLSANITRSNDQLEIALAAKDAKRGGHVYICFPTGIRSILPKSKFASVSELAATADPGSTQSTLNRWLRLAVNEPVATDEYFRVLPERGAVRVYQLSSFKAPAGLSGLPPLLFRPPQLDFAVQTLRYPVAGQETTASGLITFSGEACYAVQDSRTSGSETSDSSRDDIHLTWYDLPVPPMKERGMLAAPGQKQMRELLLKWIMSDVGSSDTLNGVDALYKSRCQAFQSWSYLTTDTRHRLTQDSTELLPIALSDRFWHVHTEPLSGLQYWWTYFIEGPYFDRFDQDWGNGLSLYGLYTFIKYTGQWELARAHWDAIERIFSWFTVTDDWEWMRASNGAHGHGTGAGDCESATFAACVAYARLAEGAGRADEYEYGIYMASRAAVFALTRFAYDDFAREYGLGETKSQVLGFHEGQGFLVGELDRYPWNVTSAISGNGIQPGNFDLYLKYAPETLRSYEQTFEAAYPNWSNAQYRYNFPTLYKGNSGYITLPHIYLRARLGMESSDVLHDLIHKAAENPHLWWLAPPVIAEVMHSKTESAYVSDWGRCAFLGGEMVKDSEGDKRRVRCIMRFDNREAPNAVEIVLPKKPQNFQINDGPVPLTDSQLEGNELRLKLRRPGLNTVVVQY